mmetsp:Transcript_14379/g.29437  ORF Transcript_14379/g.29437 Transcript_14379/m.29437 type:complete len:202 (-) Transcript_14379:1696-2301(-)
MASRVLQRPWDEPGYKGAQVSLLPLAMQAVVVWSIMAAFGVLTTACVLLLDVLNATPMVSHWVMFPTLVFLISGVFHFTHLHYMKRLVPCFGAWGFWYIPGSPEFHTIWSGVLELVLGGRVLYGTIIGNSSIVQSTSRYLFLFLVTLTFGNIFMFTHNSPGPMDPTTLPFPLRRHLMRALMQLIMFVILWCAGFPGAQSYV